MAWRFPIRFWFLPLVVILGTLAGCGTSGGRGAATDSSPRSRGTDAGDAGAGPRGDAGGSEGTARADAGEPKGTARADAGAVPGDGSDAGIAEGGASGGATRTDAGEGADAGRTDAGNAGKTDAGVAPSLAITSFGFEAVVNDAIAEDVAGTISGTAIQVVLPYGTTRTRLRASFRSTGSSVTVGGAVQISGATANDFSTPVEYVVHGRGNELVAYTVTVILAGGLRVEGHTPTDEATAVSVHASIEIAFNEPVAAESLDGKSVIVMAGAVQLHGSLIDDPASQELIFVPYGLLPEDSDVSVTISTDILSTSSEGLDAGVGFTFHTGLYAPERAGNPRVFANFESGYIRKDLDVTFTTDVSGADIETGWSKDLSATAPDAWSAGAVFDFGAVDSYGTVKVFARAVQSGASVGDDYTFVYKLVDAFPPASEKGDCDCVSGESPAIVAWASSVAKTYGGQVSDKFKTDSLEGVCTMGNGGVFDYSFDSPITDGVGADFVVGENGFRNDQSGLMFSELFYVEVSSNGVDYLRFDSASLTKDSGAFLSLDPGQVFGLGSTQVANYGIDYRQPYDLAWLRNKKAVLDGKVDLSAITHVRYIDIPGTDVEQTLEIDGQSYTYYPEYDSFGNIIRDAYLTTDSGGADVYTPGALHVAE
ncbi:MAG TPA: Ig-like domain-containing protein [Polyangiaceae bacterium]|nr:Ig-like domain-containing protein [Polyangiaceae bacterium]